MVFDAWVYGELELPKSNFFKWLSHPLGREGRAPDFISDDSGCVGRAPLLILESLHRLLLSPREFLGVGADNGRISVRGLLGDEAVLSTQGLLTGLFASAAPFGGDGRIRVVGRNGTTFGYDFSVCCGAYQARALTEQERKDFFLSRAHQELQAIERANAEERLDVLDPRPTAPPRQQSGTMLFAP